MRLLTSCLALIFVFLVMSTTARTDTIPDTMSVTYETPEGALRYVPIQSVAFFEETTSVPFDGDTTPPGIFMGTHLSSPPDGFSAGGLYFYSDQWYQIDMTPLTP